jgi:hypothetical protein
LLVWSVECLVVERVSVDEAGGLVVVDGDGKGCRRVCL